MKFTKEDLHWAVGQGALSIEQAELLWKKLRSRTEVRSTFDLSHLAYYFGALVAMSAMGWFMTLGWERYGGGGIFVISITYAILFLLAGRTLWFREKLKIPGGLLFTLAVWMTPLAIYGLERMAGIWPQGDPGSFRDYHIWIRGSWILMEIGTILAGLIALRFIRFPFLTFPVAFSLWYMSMDVTPLLLGRKEFSWHERLWVSLCFGLIMLLVSYLADRWAEQDFAFWGYLFGLLAFWGGLSLMESGSEWRKFLYCLINLGLMLTAILLERRAFLVFGALGVFGYLGHLSYSVFKDSMLFPLALTFFGLLIIYLGVQYQRHRERIEAAILAALPEGIRHIRPASR